MCFTSLLLLQPANTPLPIPSFRYYDPARQEYFFDRHRPSFEAVFYFYQSGGRLQRPMHVPEDIFADEIEFYQLPDDVLQRYRKSEGYIEEHVETLPTNKCQRCFWQLFEVRAIERRR